MPSRKKGRGRQRKAATYNTLRMFPSPEAEEQVVRKLKSEGCRITRGDDGHMTVRHPCFEHVRCADAVDSIGSFDRGLLTDKQRQELAQNYVHNYAQDLREGNFHAMDVIGDNMSDDHLAPRLADALVKADMHLSFLHFLNQSDKPISDVLPKGHDGGETSIKLPYYWVGILGLLLRDQGCTDEVAQDNACRALAKGIEPFVTSMIDGKRELFCCNHIWHLCLPYFFQLLRNIMGSKDGFLVMASYKGLLPFVAQASCWSLSRKDIVAERELLRIRSPDSIKTPEICLEAQRVICVVIDQHEDIEGAETTGVLDQIACTPLLSNDEKCNDSTLAGLVQMMHTDNDPISSHRFLIERLLLRHGYVDARVIAELIEYGRSKASMEAAQTVVEAMIPILGRHDKYEHIQMMDSRYAAAVRHGLLEFGIDALAAYGDESECKIGDELYIIAYGLCLMAMHSKTSRALRGRKGGIVLALDVLRNETYTISLINDAIDASAPAMCCNCLQECDRKKLLFCQRCNIECYCSRACQRESFALGHDELCKGEMQSYDNMRKEGLSDSELKRLAVLSSNLTMNGCRILQSKIAEVLDLSVEDEQQGNEVTVDFGACPPRIEVMTRDDADGCSGSLKCTFISPVYYGFAEKVDLEELVLEKFISRRHLGLN